jgi:hypothetical protein
MTISSKITSKPFHVIKYDHDSRKTLGNQNKIDIPATQSAGGSHEHHPRSASRHPRRRHLGAAREHHHHHVVGR